MPDAKLKAPSTSMKIRKPVGLSDRWGVRIAEKISGSGGLLSALMGLTIRERWPARQFANRLGRWLASSPARARAKPPREAGPLPPSQAGEGARLRQRGVHAGLRAP